MTHAADSGEFPALARESFLLSFPPTLPRTYPHPSILYPPPACLPHQRIERNYNFVEISDWFATRSDLIFLLFDPAKLDISDEFRAVRGIAAGQGGGGTVQGGWALRPHLPAV